MKTINDFLVRSYGWQELAVLYNPHLTPQSAAKSLTHWVKKNTSLSDALRRTGWRQGLRTLTPLQVELLLRFLGEP